MLVQTPEVSAEQANTQTIKVGDKAPFWLDILTTAQEDLKNQQVVLMSKIAKAFPIGSEVVVRDVAERSMPCSVLYICSGREAGCLRVRPINSKGGRRSIRSVHWTQIALEKPRNKIAVGNVDA